VKERPVVERLKHEPLVDAVDHFAGLLTGRIETEVHQDDETVERNQQASVLPRPPVAGGRLQGEEFGSPTFGCDARPLGRNRVGICIGEVPEDLPADDRVRIEEPLDVCRPGCVIV